MGTDEQDEQDAHRLGKEDLGKHASEERMPSHLSRLIATESPLNKSHGIIPHLAALLRRDTKVQSAYLCHPSIIQIHKCRGEGSHFCAYRNIQMLLPEPHRIYPIPEIQDLIERAWSMGYNKHGLVETGGIKGTRKHIGTSEAQALFRSLDVSCTAGKFSGSNAWRDLLDAVETYFTNAQDSQASTSKVHTTTLAPIFLQHPSHSLSIVGIQRTTNGHRQLLVFDPGYQSVPLLTPSDKSVNLSAPRRSLILGRYRRGESYLKKYRDFEMLYLQDVSYRSISE